MTKDVPRFEDEFPEAGQVLADICQTRLNNKRQGKKNPPLVLDTLYVPEEKIGRNDPCPCGSNKKYKKCCN